MKSKYLHVNFNVFDLNRSLKFYKEALGLKEVRRKEASDGSFVLAFLEDGETQAQLELTWIRDRKTPYDLGDKEFHIAFFVKNKEEAYEKHREMGCICYENKEMDLYFIEDPDGYWIEILDR